MSAALYKKTVAFDEECILRPKGQRRNITNKAHVLTEEHQDGSEE